MEVMCLNPTRSLNQPEPDIKHKEPSQVGKQKLVGCIDQAASANIHFLGFETLNIHISIISFEYIWLFNLLILFITEGGWQSWSMKSRSCWWGNQASWRIYTVNWRLHEEKLQTSGFYTGNLCQFDYHPSMQCISVNVFIYNCCL